MAKSTKTIGNVTFYLRTFPPRDQLKLFGDLQRDLLPAVGDLLAAGGGLADIDIPAALARLSSSMDGAKLLNWVDRLITPETVSFEAGGRDAQPLKPTLHDLAFNDFSQTLELLWEAVQLNFAGPLQRWLTPSGLALATNPDPAP